MIITKEISKHNELYLYMNGKLIFKKWLNLGYSKVFDVMAYDKYTYASYTDLDVKNSPNLILVKAKLRLKTEEEGGRKTGIMSGYRPDHVFEYKENGIFNQAFMREIQFDEKELLELGKEHEVKILFPFAQGIERFMEKGRKWWIDERPLQIGEAKIIEFELPKKQNIIQLK